MHLNLKLIPLFTALAAAPAFAAEPDPHAGHHPAAAAAAAAPKAKPDVKPDAPTGCPMMDDKMRGGQMMGAQMAPQTGGPGKGGAVMGGGAMAQGKMMMDGKDMHCMQAAPAGSAGAPSTPNPAPK